MNIKKYLPVILILLFLTAVNCGKKEYSIDSKSSEIKDVKENSDKKELSSKDYLGTGKSLTFDKVDYNLTWTSHPSDNLYMQEYISENDSIEKFKKLVLLQVVTGNIKLKEVVDVKVSELKKMKEIDPMVNYELFEKNGEIMLDFLLSNNLPDSNEPELIERNVYRYKSFKDEEGKDGLILFGVSERAYGNDIDKFLIDLKAHRFDVPNAVGSFNIPEIKISK